METSDAAAEEVNQSEEEPEIVTDGDENRKITAAEALTFQAPTPQNGQKHLKQFVGKLLMNCLSVFDHFVGLVLKALKKLDEVKNFIEVSKSEHLNMIFNELI